MYICYQIIHKMLKFMLNTGIVAALICCLSLLSNPVETKVEDYKAQVRPPFIQEESLWADSLVQQMSIEEKIAQLFMVAAYSNKDAAHEDYIEFLVKDLKIGGLIFMQGGPVRQANLINRYQNAASIPLLIAMDAEWGPSMRLDSTVLYPRQMMIGAIQDKQLLYETGKEYARQLKEIGVHVNFAPVVDVNINPDNPVINSRSYGELREEVVRKAYYFSKGMQDEHVLAVIKHFPGHGDTDKDSHKTLPTIAHNRARLDSVELYPFRKLINAGVGGVMIAHLYVPVLDSTLNRASTLSKAIVTDLLKDDYGFDGLIFTDALNMRGVADHFETGHVEVEAFLAGNDVLLFPQDVPKAIEAFKQAIDAGRISIEDLDERVSKILTVKQWAGLYQDSLHLGTQDLIDSLNSPAARLLNRKITEQGITLVKNENKLLPIKGLNELRIASVDFGSQEITEFQKEMKLYADVPAFSYQKDVRNLGKKNFLKTLAAYDLIIISVTETNRSPSKNFGLGAEEIEVIEDLATDHKVVLNHFGNPYALRRFISLSNIESIVVAYNDRELTQQIAAQLLFGGLAYQARLPVGISSEYPAGTGVDTKVIRLSYTDVPEEVNVDSRMLYQVDSLINEAIVEKATPGAQILVARHGKVFYHKSFGYHTYDKVQAVQNTDLYDIASVTKIAATTMILMQLYENEKFELNDSIGKYLDCVDSTLFANIRIKDILLHEAGLVSWIPFYTKTIKENYHLFYATQPDDVKAVCVAENMFALSSIRDTILSEIISSRLRSGNHYKYSDLGYYMLREMIEKMEGKALNDIVSEEFYSKLGANSLGYLPYLRFDRKQIVPTEDDTYFRKQLLRGYVHDQGAAMLGGISGHAGLFSNANDLAKLMQMLLNGGNYGGEQFLNSETIQLFTSPLRNPKDNRRGLGFDKPVIDKKDSGPACNSASPDSFGHSGFTGVVVWADPKTDLLYVFMSNRIHPDQENKKLLKLNTRTKIQEVFYQSIMD
jgi:beta-N-acetylhexosaminidase